MVQKRKKVKWKEIFYHLNIAELSDKTDAVGVTDVTPNSIRIVQLYSINSRVWNHLNRSRSAPANL